LGNEIDRLREAARVHQLELVRRERRLARRERELNVLRERVVAHAASNRFVVRGAALQEVLEHAERVAPLETTVLVRGESGTGKEFIVKMIHEHSSRSRGSLVSVNCAALTETLLESELFGHVRGAFTGAVRDKPGLFEVASAGTLFLDEIGEMALSLQAKLLRALQEGEIRRVGGERSIKVTPRVIAATNRDLRAAVAAGTFREDLYFRLGAFVITVPPLRERRESIPPLAHEFLVRAAAQFNKDVRVIAPEAMTRLVEYRWPGNVRELEHAIERAVILAPDRVISVQELPPEILEAQAPHPDESLDLELHERTLIRRALDRFHGNRRKAAEALRISTVTLWRKMMRYNLTSGTPER
jgi:transcriptional regulator with PAS, ATPase and Fis domain